MNYKGVLKRLLPFAATFAVAVFVTSFFVDLSSSRFANWRAQRWERRHGMERLMRENEQLRNENLRLRNQLEDRRVEVNDLPVWVPPIPVAPPPPAFQHNR